MTPTGASATQAGPTQADEPAKTGNPGDIGDPSVMETQAVAAALAVDVENGLSATEAARRLAQNGPNELRAAPPVPAWRRALAQFQDPPIYLLLAAVAVALVAWWVESPVAGNSGWPVDAIVIAVIVLLNGAIGHVQESEAQNAVAALARMTPATTVLRDGKPLRMPRAELVSGDVIVLAEGDALAADARLLEATCERNHIDSYWISATACPDLASTSRARDALLRSARSFKNAAAVRREASFSAKATARYWFMATPSALAASRRCSYKDCGKRRAKLLDFT